MVTCTSRITRVSHSRTYHRKRGTGGRYSGRGSKALYLLSQGVHATERRTVWKPLVLLRNMQDHMASKTERRTHATAARTDTEDVPWNLNGSVRAVEVTPHTTTVYTFVRWYTVAWGVKSPWWITTTKSLRVRRWDPSLSLSPKSDRNKLCRGTLWTTETCPLFYAIIITLTSCRGESEYAIIYIHEYNYLSPL